MECNNCDKDYICCSKTYTPILAIDEVSKYEHKKLVALTENKLVLGYVWILEKKENGFCKYFDDETHLCIIYEDRPKVCRNFDCITRMGKENA